MTVAVTNAAGYPGSHMLLALKDAGEHFVALEQDSETPLALKAAAQHRGPLGDVAAITGFFRQHGVDEVIHFPGDRVPRKLQADPAFYYERNTMASLRLIKAAAAAGVKRFVFSSSASVYGIPDRMPIGEETPLNPVTPYGASMAMAERIVNDIAAVKDMQVAVLRYFNLSGADPDGRAGEEGAPRHLIKIAAQIAVGTRREKLQIFGDDYPTPDGTCVRDYVHVSDMADAHLSALDYLRNGGESITLNCGYGFGASVIDVVSAVERVTGKPLPVEITGRRKGDPALLIADNAEIRTVLDWSPRYDDFDYIVRSAINWEELLLERDVA